MLTLTRAPHGFILQVQAAPGDWRTLRPVSLNLQPHYLLGAAVYPAAALIAHVFDNEFDPDAPLPDPLPDVPAFIGLSRAATEYLLRHCAGGAAPDNAPDLLPELARAGITLLPSHALHDTIEGMRQTRLERLLPRDGSERLIAPPTPEERIEASSDGLPVYKIVDASEGEMQALTRRPTVRKRWPWAKMEVGQKVVIPHADARQAQRAAHAYGGVAKKRFRTHSHTVTGDLIVYRVE